MTKKTGQEKSWQPCLCGCGQTFKQNTGRGRKRKFVNDTHKKRYQRRVEPKQLNVISWGLGLQSTTMCVMSALGDLPPTDFVIFCDTGWERSYSYDILKFYSQWMDNHDLANYTVYTSNLRDDMLTGNISMPLYNGKGKGMLKRQCTGTYKIIPFRQKVRQLLGLSYKGPVKKYIVNVQLGITTDEIERIAPSDSQWLKNTFPLVDLGMSREDCTEYLKAKSLPIPGKSSCVGCMYHNDLYWFNMRTNSPTEFKDACQFDEDIRKVQNGYRLYLHSSGIPLSQVDFNKTDNNDNSPCVAGGCFL